MTLESVPEPTVFTPARVRDTDSWTDVVVDVVRLAEKISGTEFVPKGIRDSVPATAAAMLYGREVGLPPMTALSAIHVIDGRPAMSAEAMRALVFAAGHELVFDETTGAVCTMRARRSGSSSWSAPFSWTLDMARAANLTRRENWARYPRAMLIARCTTDLCRMVFPDVIHGLRSLEEIGDMRGLEDGGVVPVAPTDSRRRTRSVGRVMSSDVARAVAATGRHVVEDVDLPEPPPPLPGEASEPEAAAMTAAEGPEGDAPTRTDASLSGSTTPSSSPAPVVGRASRDDAAETSRSGEEGPRLANRAVVRMIAIRFKKLGLDDHAREDARDERLALVSGIVGREVRSTKSLTAAEAESVLATISSVESLDDVRALVDAYGVSLEDPDDDEVRHKDAPEDPDEVEGEVVEEDTWLHRPPTEEEES